MIAGPWVSAGGTGHTITITALGDQAVNNYGYSGPSGHNGAFQSEDHHASLWVWRGTGDRMSHRRSKANRGPDSQLE